MYRALDKSLNRPVALKLSHEHLLNDVQQMQRFQREAKTAAILQYPNIVSIFYFGLTPQPFIAMELAPGRTLDKMLQERGRLAPAETIAICAQVLSAPVRDVLGEFAATDALIGEAIARNFLEQYTAM